MVFTCYNPLEYEFLPSTFIELNIDRNVGTSSTVSTLLVIYLSD